MQMLRLFPILTLLLAGLVASTQSSQPTNKSGSQPAAKSASNPDEKAIRDLLDRWTKAFEAKDTKAVMALYAPGDETIAYDIVPPLQYKGNDAYGKSYSNFFAMYDGPLRVEMGDLRIVTGRDVAFLHVLERVQGKLKGGQTQDMWLRVTSGLRKINGKWMLVHDHVSEPTDFAAGKSVLDLRP